MLKAFKKNLTYGRTFCGIEHTTQDGREVVHGILLKREKDELKKRASCSLNSIESVKDKLGNQKHISLILNTAQVLSKSIVSSSNNIKDIAYKAFPSSNLNDFYFEVLSYEQTHFVSLCRRDTVHSIVKFYSSQGLFVLDLSLGSINFHILASHFEDTDVFTSNAKISIKNGSVTDVSLKPKKIFSKFYFVNGIELSQKELLAFSAALQFLISNSNSKTNFETLTSKQLKSFLEKQFFNRFLKIFGIVVFTALFINFLFFSYYFNLSSQFEDRKLIYGKNHGGETATLSFQVEQKRKRVRRFLNGASSKSTYYAQTILRELPNDILLSNYTYQPFSKNIQEGVQIEVKEHHINISGISTNNKSFSKWIDDIESLNWTSQVNINKYNHKTDYFVEFSIDITLTDETAK